jgi:hypothetical protein
MVPPGIYHGYGLYPGEVKKTPLFMIHSCRVPSGWCKHKRRSHPVLCIYDISGTVYHSLTSEMKSNILATSNLTTVKMLFAMSKKVSQGVPGRGGGQSGKRSIGQEKSHISCAPKC